MFEPITLDPAPETFKECVFRSYDKHGDMPTATLQATLKQYGFPATTMPLSDYIRSGKVLTAVKPIEPITLPQAYILIKNLGTLKRPPEKNFAVAIEMIYGSDNALSALEFFYRSGMPDRRPIKMIFRNNRLEALVDAMVKAEDADISDLKKCVVACGAFTTVKHNRHLRHSYGIE